MVIVYVVAFFIAAAGINGAGIEKGLSNSDGLTAQGQ